MTDECSGILIPMVYCLASRLVVSRLMVPQKGELKDKLISKALHYPAMLASMMLWVDSMADSSAWSFQWGLDLAVVMANHLLTGCTKAGGWVLQS